MHSTVRKYAGAILAVATLAIGAPGLCGGEDSTTAPGVLFCHVDVGERGVCLYGHWLSGDVEIRYEGCNVFIGGFLAHPPIPENGVGDQCFDCPEHMIEKALGRYWMIKKILEWGRLYIVSPWSTENISLSTRHSQEFQADIARAIASEEPITADNWDSRYIPSYVAEQFRRPMPLAKCGGF